MVSSPASTNRSQSATPHPSGSTTRPNVRVQTSGLESEGSGAEEDGGGEDEDRKDNETAGSRRTSTRLAAKAESVRNLAQKSAPVLPPTTTKRASKKTNAPASSAGRTSPSSPGGTPGPLSDPNNLSKLADVAAKSAKGKKGIPTRSAPTTVTARDLLSSIDATGSADVNDILLTDPLDNLVGYKQLEDWIDGGLDMYRHEFRPLLFPIFCHFYLELVQQGFKDSAISFFRTHAPTLRERHAAELHELSTLLLPQHVSSSPLANRFRSEKYVVRMSRSGFSLLVGWLTEGTGGESTGSGEGLYGSREGAGRRARMTVLTVVNGRLKFDVTTSNTSSVSSRTWEENTGLIGSLIPVASNLGSAKTVNGKLSAYDPNAFNAQQGDLKLGPAPLSDSLREETERVLKEEPDESGHIADNSAHTNGNGDVKERERDGKDGEGKPFGETPSATSSGLIAPTTADLLPQPPTFRSVDVKREVEKVRDARKRIKLDPSMLFADSGRETNGFVHTGLSALSSRFPASALPSICAYTFHDALDGVNCSKFSEDSSLLATGFSESYIRLWSLKKEKLKGLRSDFNIGQVSDPTSLKKIREKHGSSTRKLVGHSGPIFALSFDPIGGTATPPKYLLSASADHTTRLWSLETMTNVVAYRGHNNPVWDVQWSPMGTYFATASRDRTARLWSSERMNALRVFAGHVSDVDCVQFHPNSLYLATGSSDTTCRLWDVQRGVCMRVFIGHQGPITAIASSPDGRYFASASTDLSINLWDLSSGRRIKSMTGHTAPINTLSFSACTTMLISGSADWTVRCWDVKSPGGPKAKLQRPSGRIEEGVLPDGALDEKDDGKEQTVDLLATFPTKRTPIINVQVTPRNLCLVSGPYLPPDPR